MHQKLLRIRSASTSGRITDKEGENPVAATAADNKDDEVSKLKEELKAMKGKIDEMSQVCWKGRE